MKTRKKNSNVRYIVIEHRRVLDLRLNIIVEFDAHNSRKYKSKTGAKYHADRCGFETKIIKVYVD